VSVVYLSRFERSVKHARHTVDGLSRCDQVDATVSSAAVVSQARLVS
jgi:hypothetical protein